MKTSRPAATTARSLLRNRARDRGEDFQRVLVRYGLERMLYRLSIGKHANEFILKGAMLFTLWSDDVTHRPTKDADLLGYGDPAPARLASVFEAVCNQEVDVDDGLDFDASSVKVEPIRADAVYDGVRILLVALLGKAKVKIQVDVGFGDAITPGPVRVQYPTLLDQPAPDIRAYPPATAVAEKIEAMVSLGMSNSRMKDFFDVAWCAEHLEFDGTELATAIRATFERRGTALPEEPPIALTSDFAEDDTKVAQWNAFVRKLQLTARNLTDVVQVVTAFLLPVLAAASGGPSPGTWQPAGPWEDTTADSCPLRNSERP